MNWKQGLFRFWLLAAVLWLLGSGYLAYGTFARPAPFSGDFQYDVQTKDMPWNTDWSKPLYETIYPPGKGPWPDSFSPVESQYIEEWGKDVKLGRLVTIDFPDHSILYLSAALTKDDRAFLANLFWEQRWHRYWSTIARWLGAAFGPPAATLVLGIAMAWVLRGFRKKALS